MFPNITHLSIVGLHGTQNIEIPIRDNRIVIVGVNGIGKSTVLTLLYYVISQRWQKLLDFSFESISLTIDGERLFLARAEIEKLIATHKGLGRILRSRLAHGARDVSETTIVKFLTNPNPTSYEVRRLSDALRMPPSEIRRLREHYLTFDDSSPTLLDETTQIRHAADVLTDRVRAKIYYLPTYRRIEKDLKSIVPDIEEKVRSFESGYERGHALSGTGGYIELVEFGMRDVKALTEQSLVRLGFYAKEQMNKLAGAYLGEVIRGEVENFDVRVVANLDEEQIKSVLDKATDTLSSRDRQILLETLTRIHKAPQSVTNQERYVAHFLHKLFQVAKSLNEMERPIEDFVRLCNENYLFGKQLILNNSQQKIAATKDDGTAIEFQDLSSGEKQIVSLFCHLYLADQSPFVLLIDEPELSLSVDWQSTFLPDVLRTNRCAFLGAVTHSPFIYENELERHAIDLLLHTQRQLPL